MTGEHLNAITPEEAFGSVLDVLSQYIPEIEPDREAIGASAKELIEKYGLHADLFDRVHSVFFAAISQRHAYLQRDRQAIVPEEYDRSMSFIGSATVMLGWDKQVGFDELKWQIDADAAAEVPGDTKQAYEAFTDQAMTALLQQVTPRLFRKMQQQAAASGHEEIPYDLHVLDIGFTEAWAWDDCRALGFDEAEKQRLAANALQFRDEGHMSFAGMSKGWVTSIANRPVLVLPKPVAAALLREDISPEDTNLKIAQHEYAHTQNDLTLDEGYSYGVLAEERRADIASDGEGYDNIKHFMDTDLYLASGKALSRIIEAHARDKDQSAFWVKVAADFGLQRMLELGLVVTDDFINENARPLQARVNAQLGGLDGIIQKMYEENCQDPQRKADMDARIEPHVAWFRNLSALEAEAWVQYCRDMGTGFMIGVIQERARNTEGV